MKEHQKRGSQLKVFFAIYLFISLAVGTSIVFLRRELKDETGSNELMEPVEKLIPRKKIDSTEPNLTEVPHKEPVTPSKIPSPELTSVPDKVTVAPVVEEKETKESVLSLEEMKEIENLHPFPDIKPLEEIVNGWESVPARAFPKLVAIRKPVEFQVTENGKVIANGKLPVGSMMVPMQLQGDRLFVTTAGSTPIRVTVAVEDTDFKELIRARYDRFVKNTRKSVFAKRKAEQDRRIGAVELEKTLADWNSGGDPRFDPLKASLKKGEASTYSLYDAAKWRWGGKEIIEGVEYETGFVLIISEAAFGVTEREIKALIRDGAVSKWVDVETGEEV